MNLSRLFRAYRKRKAIRLYLTRMPSLLKNRYGTKHHYTPRQVEETAREAGLPMNALCYALCIFCDQIDFDAYHGMTGEDHRYWEMQTEVAEHYFYGIGSLHNKDVAEVAATHSHSGFDQAGGHHLGSDDGHSGSHH